jgi:hypothetical protein
MSDQLFWIIAVLLVVEILSQLFQFETMGKIFVQFYIIVVHTLIGLTLATFETRDLIYYFVVLIAFVNGMRFLIYKIPAVQESGKLRFLLDIALVSSILGIMAIIDPLIAFADVPVYSLPTQIAILGSLGISLIYEMLQRANQTGINFSDYLPRTAPSFLVVVTAIVVAIVIMTGILFGMPIYLRYQIMFGYVIGVMVLRLLSLMFSKDPEFYDILYVLPTLVSMVLFIQLIVTS